MGLVKTFLRGYFSPIFMLFALVLGIGSIWLTPREEEPQIVVPLADIHVFFPGASAGEVEKLVATPLEKLLWQIDGVEYVYSISQRDMAVVTSSSCTTSSSRTSTRSLPGSRAGW
jgi:multidrug efflux pump subunit AcrB